MIEKITNNLICEMMDLNIISSQDKDGYAYRITILLESLLTLSVLLIIAVITHRFAIMTAVIVAFVALRMNTGGFHFNSYLMCLAGSCVMFSAITMLVTYLPINVFLIFGAVVSAGMILYMGHINHPNMNLDAPGVIQKKKSARIVVLIEICLMILLFTIRSLALFGTCIAMAVEFDFLLMAVAKLLKQEVKEND